jgi:hypothetical protein
MWCPHVSIPTSAMPSVERAMALYEKVFLCENVGTISLITPIAGSTMMYTAG